ncbi:hypothetical protein EPUS_01477 [Endocarpon pusillum Z07020]|uniref:REJ domain-containing protein n=1 Tax=Endocarpon pusillum (strain Z07020 / HMAS-L-300199) TaxID=1263415 RepID=U1GUM1_ENDPU|nr:uncharacterized protein EPUS_01477 [Endocarpon pusillum Z07020]ERF76143.1 hypothetical protein EPUS_01477 [Endocarpon pusillum Z07020]
MYTSSSLVVIASLLAASSYAQEDPSTVSAITQITDGQPQAPVTTPVASSSSYSNPYVTQTNSLGVVTGQPSPETSQPLPVTSQPSVITSMSPAATYVSNAPGIPVGLNTTLLPVVSSSAVEGTSAAGNLSTSTSTATATATNTRTQTASRTTGTSGSGTSGSSTSEETGPASATGAAGAIHPFLVRAFVDRYLKVDLFWRSLHFFTG